MSTTQILYKSETWQPEPQNNLVKSIPVRKGGKLEDIKYEQIPDYSWIDYTGLSLGFDDWND